jgi:MFS transporter, ACS family, glucarate transporter
MNTSSPSKSRWQGLTLVFLLSLTAYIDRSNIAVATSSILKAIHITPVQMGLINSAFSAAYAILQIPGALYVRKVGTRKAVTSIVLLWSVFTILTGFAGGFASLILIRILFGFSEAPLFPGMNQYILHWFPVKERGFSNSVKTSGTYFASIVTPPLAVWVLQSLGLEWVFILSGLLGIIAAILWYKVTRDDPSEHSGVNQIELNYIKSGLDVRIEGSKIPWKSLFSSRSFWGIGLTFFCSLYVIQFFLYWLPFYLQQHLHMDLKTMGFAASVPWCFIFVAAIFAGKVSDTLFKKNYPLFVARNVVIMIGFALAAIFMYISTILISPWEVVFCMSFGLGFAGFAGVLPWALSTDIGGEHTGMVAAWMNMWGFAAATIMPTVSALIGTRFGWNYTVLTLVAAACLGVLVTLMVNPTQKISDSVKQSANDSVTTIG